MLDPYDGEEDLDDAVHLKLDMHQLVQRNEQRDDQRGHTILEQHLSKQVPRHTIKRFDQVDEQNPRL